MANETNGLKGHRALISAAMSGAGQSMKALFEDDSFYFGARVAWTGPEEAKRVVLYGACREVVKAATLALEDLDRLEGPPTQADTVSRVVLSAFIEVQRVFARKLVETLINLVLIDGAPPELCRLLLSMENLDELLGRQADLRHYFGRLSRNLAVSIQDFRGRVSTDVAASGARADAFLRSDWESRIKDLRPPTKQSVSSRYKKAATLFSEDERLAAGISYSRLFGDLSKAAHPSAVPLSGPDRIDVAAVGWNLSLTSLLAMHVLSRVNRQASISGVFDIRSMAEKGESVAPTLLEPWRQTFAKGDLVFAHGDVCEVLQTHASPYGYTICELRYLTRPLLPDVPEDWVPGHLISPLLARSDFRDFLCRAKSEDALEVLKASSDEQLADAVRSAVAELHRRGLLLPLLQRRK